MHVRSFERSLCELFRYARRALATIGRSGINGAVLKKANLSKDGDAKLPV